MVINNTNTLTTSMTPVTSIPLSYSILISVRSPRLAAAYILSCSSYIDYDTVHNHLTCAHYTPTHMHTRTCTYPHSQTYAHVYAYAYTQIYSHIATCIPMHACTCY